MKLPILFFVALSALIAALGARARATEPTAQRPIVVVPKVVPPALRGRTVITTYEAQLAQAIKQRVTPVYSGPAQPNSKATGVVEIYVEVSTGKVIYVDVVQAPSPLHAKALRDAAWRWKFLAGPSDSHEVIVAPFTYYFVSGKDGRTKTVTP